MTCQARSIKYVRSCYLERSLARYASQTNSGEQGVVDFGQFLTDLVASQVPRTGCDSMALT
jgi:hypothetical protein